jgi:hypothetical protein
METNSQLIPGISIKDIIEEIQDRAVNKKKILSNFLKCHKLADVNVSINEYVQEYLLQNEHNTEDTNMLQHYTYYIGGGFSWNSLEHKFMNSKPEHLSISNILGILEVVFIYNHKIHLMNKFEIIYKELFIPLQALLYSNKIKTKIEFENVEQQANGQFEYLNNRKLFKPFSYKIKLVIDAQQQGGRSNIINKKRKLRRKKQSGGTPQKYALMKMLLHQILQEKCQDISIEKFNTEYNAFSILEFNFEHYIGRPKNSDKNMIEYFHDNFIERNIDPYESRNNLNKLNQTGALLFVYLNTYDKKNEMGLNINKYRQKIFLECYKDNHPHIQNTFKNILTIYNNLYHQNWLHDIYFVEKIEDLISKYSSHFYESYIEFFNKWFVSLFRPAVNAFIMEINEELYNKFAVKLFIAGGDAMRRYDPDISFTKDIDTKLYIKNAVTKSKLSRIDEEKAKRLAVYKDIDEFDSTTPIIVLHKRGIIKKQIIDTIAKHIVKLRNYLEQNISAILEHRETVTYKSDIDYNYVICLSTVPENKINNQRFRTREIRKSKLFPVDLYSLDFKTYLIKQDKNGEIINIKDLNISVLDVVLEDDGDYHPYYHTNVDIPVASPYFIINDFTNTYNNDDRALARIASDKYIKDIERYNKMYKIYQEYDDTTFSVVEPDYIKNINDIELQPLKENLSLSTVNKQTFINDINEIIMKIKSKTPFNIDDFVKILNMMKNRYFKLVRDDLRTFLEDFGNFKTNLYFEDLNKVDTAYLSYSASRTIHDDKHYVDNYLELFNHIISQTDGKQKHVISFSNKMIKTAIKGMKKQLSSTSAISGPSRTQKTPQLTNITPNKEKRKESSPTQSSKRSRAVQ